MQLSLLNCVDIPPHLVAFIYPDSDVWQITYEAFEQRELALEQLFRKVHVDLLTLPDIEYRPHHYRQFWDLTTTDLIRWVPNPCASYYVADDVEVKDITEDDYAARGGLGCCALISLDWFEHQETISGGVDQQLCLFSADLAVVP